MPLFFSNRIVVVGIVVLLCAAIFAIDLIIPLGVAVGVLYIFPLLAVKHIPGTKLIIWTAVLCSLLTIFGLYVSTEGGIFWQVLSNRALALLVIWTTVWFIIERKQTENALRESELRFKTIFLKAPIGKALVNREHQIIDVNNAFCNLLGYSKEELIGIQFKDITFPDDVDISIENHQKLFAGEIDFYQFEKRYLHKKGETKWALLNVSLVRDIDSKPHYAIAQMQDINDRKQAEEALRESEKKYRGLLETAADGMVIVNAKGEIEIVNQQLQKMIGYTPEELIGHPVEVLVPERFKAHKQQKGSYLANPRVRMMGEGVELFVRRKDGSEFPAEISLSPLKTVDELNISAAIRDITERKEAEEELQQHREHLEDEIKQRTASLMAVNQELEDYAHTISHDLKAPLRAIEGFAAFLAEDYKANLDETGHGYLSEIQGGVMRMGQMIDDLLTHARLGEQFAHVGPVNISEVVNQVQKNLASDIRASQAVITTEGKLLKINGHQATLELLLQNLISNAIKFVPPGTPPEITVSISETPLEYCIAVRDNGIGIEEEHQETIFNIFERLHTREAYPGTGIGLAIVKKAVQLHRGRLWLESEVGTGTTFYFSIAKDLQVRMSDRSKSVG